MSNDMQTMQTIVAELAYRLEMVTVDDASQPYMWCPACHKSAHYDPDDVLSAHIDTINHTDNCLVLRARDLLAGATG